MNDGARPGHNKQYYYPLRKKKKQEVIALLKSKNYDVIDNDEDYKYLRTMTIDSLEEENVAKLLKDKGLKEAELNILKMKIMILKIQNGF